LLTEWSQSNGGGRSLLSEAFLRKLF
jgi:hypothetical protein